MKWTLLTLMWVGTLCAAFFVGRGSSVETVTAPEEEPGETMEELKREVAQLRREIALRPAPGEAGEAAAGVSRGGTPVRPPGAAAAKPFSLEGIRDGREFSRKMMAYVDAQLDRGPQGFQAILDTIALIGKSEDQLQALFPQEEIITRELYPWLKFAVEREDEMVDMTEYVFKTMAENPGAFAEMENDPLELFTEAFAVLLPGAVDDERLDVFRGYAKRIIETPQAQQPKAVQRNRSEIKRALERFWAKPLTPEAALEKLRSGRLSQTEAARLLAVLGPEQLARVDVDAVLVPLLTAGRYEAVRAIQALPAGTADLRSLDAAVLAGMGDGVRSWFVRSYLDATGRRSWEEKTAFLEGAFLGTPQQLETAAQVLGEIAGDVTPAKRDWVRDVLGRYTFTAARAAALKKRYGIE